MKRTRNNFTAADLIPEYWDLTAETIEDILFLGKATIRQMIRSWRYNAESLSRQIKSADEKLKLLQGKNATAIREFAKRYENPEFPHIGIPQDSSWKQPEPLDAASINRKSGATTFNVCGWCEHTGGGTCRYSYHITTHCSIKTEAGIEDEERHFNTPCFLGEADDLLFAQLRLGLSEARDRLIKEKRETDAKIKFLLKLEKSAEQKPALPDHRPHDWFDIDDPVVCFVGGWDERIIDNQWATAKVIAGYRHHDGCVSVCYNERIHSGPYLEGHGGGYGMSRPEIMHAWEFDYLREHTDFAEVWVKNTPSRFEDFSPEQLLEAFATVPKLGGIWEGVEVTEENIRESRQDLLDKLEERHEKHEKE